MSEANAPGQAYRPPTTRDRLVRGAAIAVPLLFAIWPRLRSLPILFSRGELLQWDGDSAYHLKRIHYALAHFPALPRFDAAMNWPRGGVCHWPDGFDLLAAAWGLVAGLGDPQRAAMAVLLFSTVVGLLVVWAAMDLARLVVPVGPASGAAVVAVGLLVAVVPSSAYQSQVGFLDHHIAELLSFLLLAGWALRRLPRSDAPTVSGLAWELGGSLAATFALWVYSGGVLYVAIAFVIVAFAVLRDARPGFLGSGVVALGSAALATALLTLPALRVHGMRFSYPFPSLLQPLLVAGAAGALLAALLSARLARSGLARGALLAAAIVIAGAVLAVAVPDAADQFRSGLTGWLLRKDPWIASIAEFQPFGWNAPVFVFALFGAYGAIGVLAPLILAAGAWIVIRATGPRGVAFVLLSAVFVVLTLHQVRFERIGQPLLMIILAAILAAIDLRGRGSSNPLIAGAFPLIATVVLIAADPTLRGSLTRTTPRVPPSVSAALALRDHAGAAGPQGVLASWDHGHFITFHSGLATPTNGFGSYLDAETFSTSEAVFKRDEATMDRYLAERRIRFVVAGPLSASLLGVGGQSWLSELPDRAAQVLNLDYMRSFGLSPLLIGGSAIPGASVRHLEHLMPLFATREQPMGLAFSIPALWVYERVRGARIAGSGTPGARVIASLDFREQRRPHVWRAFADIGPDGRFQLVVPFPTSVARYALSSAPRYALRAGDGAPIEVEVAERAVRDGATIEVGRLRATATQPGSATRSRSVKTAPPAPPLPTEISPPKDSAIP